MFIQESWTGAYPVTYEMNNKDVNVLSYAYRAMFKSSFIWLWGSDVYR